VEDGRRAVLIRGRVDSMDSGPAVDLSQPFTRSHALAAGITPKVLRGPRFRALFRNVYVEASAPDTPTLRARAALAVAPPGAFASHASAARILEVPIPTLPDEHLTVLRQQDRRRRPGIRWHVLPKPQTRVVDGTRVSAPEQLFVELASLLGLVDLVIVGDHLVRHKKTTLAKLLAFCAQTRLPHADRARHAASFVRDRVDSPMETRLRMLIVLAGLPEPEVNLTIRDADGEPLRRHDLAYRGSRTYLEYDGRHHVDQVERWEKDLERREAVDDEQARMLVVTSRGIFVEPEHTLERVWRVLRSRGEPGLPERLSDDWRPHFPGRR
jgi:hypothetical protein